jgi:protein-tyrosine-phosphatase
MPEPLLTFVCTGNTCRSPLAAGIFYERFARARNWRVGSAGVHAVDGEPASPEAVIAAQRRGLDLARHRATLLTARHLSESALVIAMTQEHKAWILGRFPGAGNVATLGELAGNATQGDVPDPMGGPQSAYERTAEVLDHLLTRAWPEIERRLVRQSTP